MSVAAAPTAGICGHPSSDGAGVDMPMSNRRILHPSRMNSSPGGRVVRKRAPVFPGPMLDQTLIDLLTQADVPLSAYDLASRLRERGRQMAVMSIYRALDRLCATNAIEKVETLSAYRVKDIPNAILTICPETCGMTLTVL